MFEKMLQTMTEWLARQEVTTVLLFANLTAMWGIAWYTMQHGVPAHLQMIQQGYEKIETQHEREMNRVIDILTDGRIKNAVGGGNVARFDVRPME